ncbi:hypothetical protein D9613_000044 [Agrocybe pediades]|uniref:Uncharacterized protein n=1 Tax=Agrocybe pediades TaxID=84607 RepID=A0A8H4VUV3_9AGAR|nr:hypothetical protein D9613_000044 [Agrocybe pediades]
MSINHPQMSTVETARLASCSGLSSASTQLSVSTTSNTALPSISIAHPAPPIPAYSPRPPHAAIDIEFPATSNQHSLSLPAPSPSIVIDNSNLDPDLVTYAQTHDRHEGAAVVRRLPESFPSDMASLRSSQPPESLPPYGVNDPPPYRRRVENLQREPDTLAMVFFKSGFFFPAFWVFGALMLVTPLRSPNPFDPQAALSHLSMSVRLHIYYYRRYITFFAIVDHLT